MIDLIFPPLNNSESGKLKPDSSPMAQLRYSTFSYWRDPLPVVDVQEVDKSGNLAPTPGVSKVEEGAKK